MIDRNFFSKNVGLKRHNGGAGVIRCQHTTADLSIFDFRSGKARTLHELKDEDGNVTARWLDMPYQNKTIVKGYVNKDDEYEINPYGTIISKNSFSQNYSGMRGTAILTELVSHLEVVENKFMQNGPVHAYREMENSPYY